jgi:hypothetical protein
MNLVSLPDGRIVNLDYLTHVERTGDYVSLHLAGGSERGVNNQGETRRGCQASFGAYRR